MLRGLTINDRYRLQLGAGHYSRSEQRSSLENPSQWLTDLLTGGSTTAGVPVNDTTALSLSAVFACCRVLSDSIASLPIGLYRTTPDGGTEPADNRPENNLLAANPSDRYTSYTFRSTLQLHLGLRGNAYARILRDGRGGARELRIYRPEQVQPFFQNDKLYYRVSPPNAKQEILFPYEILHIAALSQDGINGISPIQALRDTIGTGIANRDNQARTLKRGRVDGLLKSSGSVTDEQASSIRKNFKAPLQSGDFPLLEGGLDYQSISLTPGDAEYINTAKLTRQDIAGAYRVPLHMIGDLERATFSNIEHQSLEFVKFSLMPWIKAWEQELNRKLLPETLQRTHFYRFNVDGLLRGDFKTRMDGYTKAIQWGILNRDEVRELENRNPIPDGLGKIYITPLNMAPITADTLDGEPDTDNTQNADNEGNSNDQNAGQPARR